MSAGALAGPDAVARALSTLERAGAAAADALLIERDALEARVRGGEVESLTQAREGTLGLRAFMAGARGLRAASTSTSDLLPGAIDRLAEETVALARATAEDESAGLPEGGFAADLPDLELMDAGDRELGVEAHVEAARRAEAAARAVDARITNTDASESSAAFSRVAYGNSAGFLGEYESAQHALYVGPIASQDGSMQTDYWLSLGRRRASLEAPEDVGRRAAERALRRLGARRVRTCEVPVIFEAPAARALLANLVACLSGYAVYRGASCLAGRLGERVASEHVTVVDDGRLPGGLGSKPFDGEGQPTRRNVVIERGGLLGFLLDSYAARKLGARTTGNASRGAGGPPTAGPTNLWLEPGASALDELVADTRSGLLVTSLFGMGFNPVTGDLSRGASGVWIEDGALAFPVEEITVAGNLLDVLGRVDAVAGDLAWLGRVAAPSLRVSKLTVAGE